MAAAVRRGALRRGPPVLPEDPPLEMLPVRRLRSIWWRLRLLPDQYRPSMTCTEYVRTLEEHRELYQLYRNTYVISRAECPWLYQDRHSLDSDGAPPPSPPLAPAASAAAPIPGEEGPDARLPPLDGSPSVPPGVAVAVTSGVEGGVADSPAAAAEEHKAREAGDQEDDPLVLQRLAEAHAHEETEFGRPLSPRPSPGRARQELQRVLQTELGEGEDVSAEGSGWPEFPGQPLGKLPVLELIRKDVKRTRMNLPFFRSAPTQELLESILLIWALKHPRLGYRQGMNELLATTIIAVLQDRETLDLSPVSQQLHPKLETVMDLKHLEPDVFWLFHGVMDRMETWYFTEQDIPSLSEELGYLGEAGPSGLATGTAPGAGAGVLVEEVAPLSSKIQMIEIMLSTIDRPLYEYLQACDAASELFLVKWIRVLFTREFGSTNPHENASLSTSPAAAVATILAVWDHLFDAPEFDSEVDFVCLAMMEFIRFDLLDTEPGMLLLRLMKYPPVTKIEELLGLCGHLRQAWTTQLMFSIPQEQSQKVQAELHRRARRSQAKRIRDRVVRRVRSVGTGIRSKLGRNGTAGGTGGSGVAKAGEGGVPRGTLRGFPNHHSHAGLSYGQPGNHSNHSSPSGSPRHATAGGGGGIASQGELSGEDPDSPRDHPHHPHQSHQLHQSHHPQQPGSSPRNQPGHQPHKPSWGDRFLRRRPKSPSSSSSGLGGGAPFARRPHGIGEDEDAPFGSAEDPDSPVAPADSVPAASGSAGGVVAAGVASPGSVARQRRGKLVHTGQDFQAVLFLGGQQIDRSSNAILSCPFWSFQVVPDESHLSPALGHGSFRHVRSGALLFRHLELRRRTPEASESAGGSLEDDEDDPWWLQASETDPETFELAEDQPRAQYSTMFFRLREGGRLDQHLPAEAPAPGNAGSTHASAGASSGMGGASASAGGLAPAVPGSASASGGSTVRAGALIDSWDVAGWRVGPYPGAMNGVYLRPRAHPLRPKHRAGVPPDLEDALLVLVAEDYPSMLQWLGSLKALTSIELPGRPLLPLEERQQPEP